MKRGTGGVHRKKVYVNMQWLRMRMMKAGFETDDAFARELCNRIGRRTLLDKASMSRRMHGRIPFTAIEVQAMAHIFETTMEEIMPHIGGLPSA